MPYPPQGLGQTVLERSPGGIAAIFESSPYIDTLAGFLEGINADFGAKVLKSISSSKANAVLKNTYLSGDKAQALLYRFSLEDKLVDILTYDAPSVSVTANTTITGVNRYRSLSIASGVTLTVDGQPGAIIAYSLDNGGTIDKTATGAPGGAPGGAGGGAGGAGGGELIVFSRDLSNSGAIRANGAPGGNGSTVAVRAAGGKGGSGLFVVVGSDVAGSGGAGGNSAMGGAGGVNGGGGGGAYVYIGGAGDGSS